MERRSVRQLLTTTDTSFTAPVGILTPMKKSLALVASFALILPTLSGCAPETASSTSEVVFVGMMGAPKVLDPAGTRSFEDATLLQQIFPSLMNSDGGAGEVVPEIAVSGEYASEFEYTVELKPDLTFSNGHALTASDVVHSINRIKSINDPNGPAVMIETIESVSAQGDTTVVFKPTRAYDQALPALLAGLPGLVVDEEVFPADRLLSNGEVAGSNAFAGPYTLAGYSEGSALRLNPNPDYVGVWGVPQNKGLEVRYYTNADQLMYDSSQMTIDLAIVHRQSLAASTGPASEAFGIDLVAGPNVETGMLLLNPKSEAFTAAGTVTGRDAKDLRRVFIEILDERSIVRKSFGQFYPFADGLVPDQFGGNESPGQDKVMEANSALRKLTDLKVKAPVQIEVSFPETLYGTAPGVLVSELKTFVDDTRAFEIVLKPLSDQAFLDARESLDYDVLFDYHYPLYADPEAFLYPSIADVAALSDDSGLVDDLNQGLSSQVSSLFIDHLDQAHKVESQLVNSTLLVPLVWAGRQALVRDGISGADEMLAADGKLVLAKLYRVLMK